MSKKTDPKPEKKTKSLPMKKAAKKKAATGSIKKVAPKKKPAKRRARSRRLGSIPKYHLSHRSWDKKAVMKVIFETMVSTSLGLAYICRGNKDLPSVKTVFIWLSDEDRAGGDKPLCDMYARAKDIQIDYMADETIDICDNIEGNPVMVNGEPLIINDKVVRIIDNASVQHAKLRSDNRKWIASKLKHRKYGDKLELSSDPERPLSSLSDEALTARIKVLQKQIADGNLQTATG